MPINKNLKVLTLIVFGWSFITAFSQEANSSYFKKENFFIYRGNNVLEGGLGTSVINGDYSNPMFEIYFKAGYKRYIIPYVNVNVSYHKFNLAAKNIYNEGFMSFDVNLEATLMPYDKFSPHIYVGGGIHASNYFNQTDPKAQAGIALEYIFSDNIGLKIFSDYNHVFSDLVDGLAYGKSNDVYWRLGFGVNYYFGRKRVKHSNQPTIINSNPIIDNK
ncbi:Curli production assembly/transport component CsgG [Mangrovimonas cancribranchiae]|uniref:Curli production assembly/transport component CsgG n=1 Tax=Mangrovimonas cancribranchiae TaxID=3080055 RepID=A0AAU6P924_9FLAO